MGKKVRSQSEREFLVSSLPDFKFLGFLSYDQAIVDADLAGRSPLDASQQIVTEVGKIYHALLSTVQASSKVN